VTTDPILARQVETNEKEIEELKKRLEDLSSVDMDSNVTNNNNPSYYTSIITYEIKQCAAVGLSSLTKFDGIEYSYVHTYQSNSETVDIQAYQQAYAIDAEGNIVTAHRVALEGDTWSDWKTGLAENAGGSGSGGGSVTGDTEPDPEEQEEGGIWLEPIEAVNT